MKTITCEEAAKLYIKSLVSDILLNPDQNFKKTIDSIVEYEDRAVVDQDELIPAILLTVFGLDMQNLNNTFQNTRKSIEIKTLCIKFLNQEVGFPDIVIKKFIDRSELSMDILIKENRPNMIIMPIMIHLNIWTIDNCNFAMQDALYATLLTAYIGKWKKITQIYTIV